MLRELYNNRVNHNTWVCYSYSAEEADAVEKYDSLLTTHNFGLS
jgi:hypothetical protein